VSCEDTKVCVYDAVDPLPSRPTTGASRSWGSKPTIRSRSGLSRRPDERVRTRVSSPRSRSRDRGPWPGPRATLRRAGNDRSSTLDVVLMVVRGSCGSGLLRQRRGERRLQRGIPVEHARSRATSSGAMSVSAGVIGGSRGGLASTAARNLAVPGRPEAAPRPAGEAREIEAEGHCASAMDPGWPAMVSAGSVPEAAEDQRSRAAAARSP
jgi:hypothetical protein